MLLLPLPILFFASRGGTKSERLTQRAPLRAGRGKQEKHTPVLSPLSKPQAVNVGWDVLCAQKKKLSPHFMFIHVNVQSI